MSKGKGTLRNALKVTGPRIIVFEVAGVIDLEMKSLDLTEPEVFIAGQTAPGPGVTLIRGGLRIRAGEAVVQHLRIRPGDAGQAKGSGWDPDGITTAGSAHDVWIDHCSVTWSLDENVSASGTEIAAPTKQRGAFTSGTASLPRDSTTPHTERARIRREHWSSMAHTTSPSSATFIRATSSEIRSSN